MLRGYLLVAMGDDYVTQACLCAKSIRETQKINNVSILTSDPVPEKYTNLFDKVIEVPWHDKNARSFYVTEHRWKNFHVTPYSETVVLDTDMIFIDDVSHWWDYLEHKSIAFITNIIDYKGNLIDNDYYRKTFTANNLPNIYNAFHYFKKDDVSLEYYKILESVCNNYQEYYKIFAPKITPSKSSMDVNHAIAVLVSNIQDFNIESGSFVHMKSKLQGWETASENWTDDIPFYVDSNFNIKIGNYRQSGILHYTEHKFCQGVIDVC